MYTTCHVCGGPVTWLGFFILLLRMKSCIFWQLSFRRIWFYLSGVLYYHIWLLLCWKQDNKVAGYNVSSKSNINKFSLDNIWHVMRNTRHVQQSYTNTNICTWYMTSFPHYYLRIAISKSMIFMTILYLPCYVSQDGTALTDNVMYTFHTWNNIM